MLEVKNLRKSFDKQEVLKGISFKVQKNEVLVIIGPSGCGKSTLLRCINLLEVPTKGDIIFEGVNITKKNVNLSLVRQKMGMLFQQFNLFPHLTVTENVILSPVNLGIKTKEEAKKECYKLLKDMDLIEKKDAYPDELSGGQKQRVALIRTLIMNPDIILLDEPTSALDPEMVQDALNLIKELVKRGITMIIVSHEMNFVKECASKVIFMENGKINAYGTPEELFNNKENKRLQEFLSKTDKR